MKKVLFVASECSPFVKTGGLADVVGALPREFNKEYWDVRVVLPNYSCIPWEYREKFEYITHFYMSVGPYIQNKYVGVLQYEHNGVTYYFIDNQDYFTGFYPYDSNIRFDLEKFIFFDKAVLSMLPLIQFQPDIIHCHDWQTGMIPVLMKNEFMGDMFFWGMKSIMTIHNLKFQGKWDIKTFQGFTGLGDEFFTSDRLEFEKGANMLKGGIVYADYITTVSNSYAHEIQSDYYGEGLGGLLYARRMDMQGIVNGIDYSEFDPNTDSTLVRNYNSENFRKYKIKNKEALQEELGLNVDKKAFVIGLISRLTDQKGLDLIDYAFHSIMDEFTQFVVIGVGEQRYEDMFRYYESVYQGRVSANIYYSDELSHRVYAGCDAFLMPSRFEPCGLSQMISMRYGTVPIVRETGGLKDTVQPYNEYIQQGNGFSFTNYNGDEMLHIINYAKSIYFNKKAKWNKIIERAMKTDFSWNVSQNKYENLYNYLIGEFR
ncbi:glycogen synthase GlgA [Eubacterium oxidoreducens]|uniref:Glycogen synthase n=1 Tax=Eubacterium oxidoreducens TaxID=1732 RepID=A0A1G6AL11_EUBOX|nr:glycogen synthase GlgA [Eubacterium oxidoreducens]SDB09091.1 starch synthase [Eubacterium oxidoreducens]